MNLKAFFKSQEFQAVEHSVKVAAYIGVSGFLATLVTEFSNNKDIANLVSQHPTDALIFMLVNMILAGLVKYVNMHKQG